MIVVDNGSSHALNLGIVDGVRTALNRGEIASAVDDDRLVDFAPDGIDAPLRLFLIAQADERIELRALLGSLDPFVGGYDRILPDECRFNRFPEGRFQRHVEFAVEQEGTEGSRRIKAHNASGCHQNIRIRSVIRQPVPSFEGQRQIRADVAGKCSGEPFDPLLCHALEEADNLFDVEAVLLRFKNGEKRI